ncbi:MAG: PAAR-like domain-containing protein [Enhygromyxa sp.]
MTNKVFANSNAVVCAAGSGKIAAAFPDVCMSPPGPPTGPMPAPYADTSYAKDTKRGSKSVKIGGKPVYLYGQSYLASSPLGNEGATKSFGASILTHTITGKTQFAGHSLDVMVEGKYVCRHLDLSTSNHASYPGATPPYPEMETMNLVALQRIEERVCPCCNSKGCPAAFADGQEAQSLEDFYGLNAKGDDGLPTKEAADRAKTYKRLLAMKHQNCTCEGRVFPEAPCDVFREPDPVRTKEIEERWRNSSKTYRTSFLAANPNAIGNYVAMNPSMPVPRKGETFGKVDHLTPKGAGGCPDNPGNLQPHDLLCGVCRLIDDTFGEWQANNVHWRQRWNDAFRRTGIKRRRLDAFTPGWW